jgi:hypothetical protein
MSLQTHLTIGEISAIYDIPAWKIRRVVDSLNTDIPRIGIFRAVPRCLLGEVARRLQDQGWLTTLDEVAS